MLFALERMNGIIGSEYDSGRKHSVVHELSRKFLERQHCVGVARAWADAVENDEEAKESLEVVLQSEEGHFDKCAQVSTAVQLPMF